MNGRNLPSTLALVDKTRLAMKLASLFVIYFCSLFCLLVGLHRAQNTRNIEMQQLMNIQSVQTFVLTRRTIQYAWSRFVQHKTKQLCSLPFQPVDLINDVSTPHQRIFPGNPLPPFSPGLYNMSLKNSSSPNIVLSSVNKFKRSTCPFSLWYLHLIMNTAQH